MDKLLEYTDATNTDQTVGATSDIKISDIDITDVFDVTLVDTDGNISVFEVYHDGGPHMRPKVAR